MRNVLFIFMILFSVAGVSRAAEVPSDSQEWLLKDESPALIRVKEPQVIFAPVAGVMQGVAELNPSHGFYIYPMKGEFRELQFGNDRGFINSEQLSDKKPKVVPPLDTLNELNNPIYDYLITISNTNVFGTPDESKSPVATLFGDLRYPVLAKMVRENREGEKIVWLTIRLADRLAYIRLSDVELDKGIPILTYHHILKDSENRNFRHTSTTTSVEAFKAQMDYLKQAGYRTISLDDVAGYLAKENNLPGKVVALTFDDGLKSVYRYAYPILKQNDQKATLFVISSRVKSKPQKWAPDGLQFMCWPELMQSRDVFDIQSHTHFLHRLDNRKNPIIFSRKEHTILLDYQRSQRVLTKLNPEQHYLAYPFGAYNQDAMDAAQQAGMTMAVTTIQGKVRLGDNPYALKRLYALRTDPIEKFATMIGNSGPEVVNKDIVVDR